MKKKKKRYYRKQDNELRQLISIILWFLTPAIIFFVLWGLLACIIILIIIGICYLTHRLIKWKWRNTKIWAVILSYLIACWIIAWWLYICYNKIDVISNKIDEMTNWFSKIISIWQGKKWNLELQPNELWIMQEVLNNMTTTTWQVQ